jgi:DtxR family transcriptional regulator, iron-dependent repressor
VLTGRDAMRCAADTIRPMASSRGTVAEQEYLEMLFWLFEAGLPMTGANLARAMQLSAPTVHEMLGRLERDGYIARNAERMIEFTPSGREHAEHIVSRHRMIERFLTDVVGVPWDDVHEEAEQLEHAMTPRFEAYVRASVGDAKTCPHGHPIRVGERIDGVPLADCEVGAAVTILRLENEAEDLLHYLKEAGVEPGMKGEIVSNDGELVSVRADGDTATVTASVAETVSVLADPSPPARIALPEQLVLGRERYGR